MPFVVFEGLDGSGKSTLIQGLESRLTAKGHKVVVTREPGGTPLGEALRNVVTTKEDQAPTPKTEALLYQAIRAQHVDLVIRPAMERGDWILCDRFRASSVAFQSGARGLKEEQIEWLNDFSTGSLQPELTVLLDLTVEESQRRLQKRYSENDGSLDRFESEATTFHERVRASYLKQSKAPENIESWKVLDSSKPPEELLKELLETPFLKQKGI